MIYSVYIDGQYVYDIGDESFTLLDPSYENELNTAGSFNFKMRVNHACYDIPKPLLSDVEIYEKDNPEPIWFGRPIKITENWNKEKIIECEGALAYFNDSIQRPKVYDDGDQSIREFFSDLIEHHNEQVASNRQFIIGEVNIDENFVYRKLNYETTFTCLKQMCLDAEGGYLITRKVNGTNYIDWVREVPYVSDQPLEYAVNLKDLEKELDFSELATSIIPLGEEDNETGVVATCQDANGGLDYVDNQELISQYGRITKTIKFDGLIEAIDLLEAAEKYLEENQFEPLNLTISASELSYLNDDYTAFRVGQIVHVVSDPHAIDLRLPILKIGGDLDSADKAIEVGNVKKKTLTEIYKED